MHIELTEKLEVLVKHCIDELSFDLVEWEVKQRGKTVVIDILADKCSGGITIDECILINKRIVLSIEEKQWFGEDFVVEVSSPGLDRELKTLNDYSRALGKKVRVHLLESIEGKVEHHGMITGAQGDQIFIQVKDKIIEIPLECISKAVQIIE